MIVVYGIFAFLFGVAVLAFIGAMVVTAGQILLKWWRHVRH